MYEMIFLLLSTGQTQKMNLFQSITSALDNSLAKDPTAGKLHSCNHGSCVSSRMEDLVGIFL
jgi:hypothetical protein